MSLFLFICLILLTRNWSLWVNNQHFIIGQAIEVIDEEVYLILQGGGVGRNIYFFQLQYF